MKILNAVIQLRRDSETNFNKIKDTFIPVNGEVVLIDTISDGLRAKVGDGVKTLAELSYTDETILNKANESSGIVRGYYLNDNFFTDSTYLTTLPRELNKIYIDNNSKAIYYYDGIQYISINDALPNASDIVAGISKLYQNGGQNIDGSMSQKAVTDGVQSISFTIDATDKECLILDLPWD